MIEQIRDPRSARAELFAFLGAGLVIAFAWAQIAATQDALMKVHAGIIGLSGLTALVWLLYRLIEGNDGRREKGYNDSVIRAGVIASVFWGIAGLLAGVVIAAQLACPVLNFDLPWLSFGRLRPLHTSAVIFAFGGNVLICTSSMSCSAPAARVWPAATVALVRLLGLPAVHRSGRHRLLLGITQSKEYAEPEWYVDLWLTVVWVVYLLVFLGTLSEAQGAAHLCGELVLPAFIVTVAMLHVVNNLAIPVSP